MQNILVVEDDYDLNQAICYSLKKSGYGVYGVTFMEKGKQTFIENQIDLILLDVNLPDGEGFSFCQWVKKQREVPVIYLTARDMEEDALAGYESGAEDYVTKPFSMKILLRKIDVILKRTASVNHRIFTDENLYIDLDNARVMVKGQENSVTPTEYRLLCQFLMNRGQLLTYDLLLERLWDSGGQFVDRHALAVNINRLRGKIEDENAVYAQVYCAAPIVLEAERAGNNDVRPLDLCFAAIKILIKVLIADVPLRGQLGRGGDDRFGERQKLSVGRMTGFANGLLRAGGLAAGAVAGFGMAAVRDAGACVRSVAVGGPFAPAMIVHLPYGIDGCAHIIPMYYQATGITAVSAIYRLTSPRIRPTHEGISVTGWNYF